jgi:hypothetical protein
MKKSTNLSTGVQSDAVRDAIRTSYNLNAVPRLTIDWNYNRYTNPTADNTPSEDTEGYDIDRFPIESIIHPLRPQKGAAKARVNEAVAADRYTKSTAPRFYVSDTDDVYKYWTSPYPTNGSGVFPNHTDGITTARPRVEYDRVVLASKIVIKLENTWASPNASQVRIKTSVGGTYSTIATNPTADEAAGIVTLYYTGSSWSTTKPLSPVMTSVAGIEYRVTSLKGGTKRDGNRMSYRVRSSSNEADWGTWHATTGANSSLNVIAIEAHLEQDLTNRLITVEDTFDMSDKSQLYPIGTITSNVGTLTLANDDGIFNVENETSLYYGLIEPNAEVNLEYIYTINGVQHSVQEFKMYINQWSSDDEGGTTEVELEDYSKYLKEIKPNPFMVENKSSAEIVWRVLDSVGFVNYEIGLEDVVNNSRIPIFWTTGDDTVWEVLDQLAQATQTAIYFDENGTVQVQTREAAFRDSDVDWNLLGQNDGLDLADIQSWSPESEYEANKIEVKYKSTKWKLNSLGKPAMSVVWQPDDTLTVRSSQLLQPINDSSTELFIGQKEAVIWPYESKVTVDGEIIQYKGKTFVYYTYTEGTDGFGNPTYTAPVRNTVVAKSQEDYDNYNKMTPYEYRNRNNFTGGLVITERGVWNTEQKDHTVDINGWTTKMELNGASDTPTSSTNPAGFSQNKKESTAVLNTPGAMNGAGDTFWAFRGGPASSGYKSYGTRFKFVNDKASTTQRAGISYQLSGARENGYYVEVRTSGSLSAADRQASNEVTVYSKTNGKYTVVANGAPVFIGQDIWYELDIYHSTTVGNSQRISVFLNGQLVARGTTDSSTAKSDSGRFGMFARGKTHAEFEYIYAVARPIVEPDNDYGFYDLKYGGVRGGQWQQEYVWETRTRRVKIRKHKWTKEEYKHNLYLFDEFGPYVHEVREFDVKFDPNPVRFSYLFNTNEWFSVVPEYTSNPFGAKFVIANTAREHAILNGEDNLIYAGASSGVNQVCVVLGQNLEISDEESVIKTNDSAIRARGEISSELSSDWIQSKEMATELAEWMSLHWSDSVDEAEVEIFGNPLLQVGDIVDVSYDRQDLYPSTHVYFVVGAKNSFENGISTTLTLRRRRAS